MNREIITSLQAILAGNFINAMCFAVFAMNGTRWGMVAVLMSYACAYVGAFLRDFFDEPTHGWKAWTVFGFEVACMGFGVLCFFAALTII